MRKGVLFLTSLLLAFSLMNFGFAGWSGGISIEPIVQTGQVNWGFDETMIEQSDKGPDLTCAPGFTDVRSCPEGKDVGRTDLSFGNSNSDNLHQEINIVVSNAYPYYYNNLIVSIKNSSKVPLDVSNALITWNGNDQILTGETIYYLCGDGEIIANGERACDDAVFEVRWKASGTEADNLQNPDEVLQGFLEFQLLSAVLPSHTYNFSVALAAKTADLPVGPGNDEPTEPEKPSGGDGGGGGGGDNGGGNGGSGGSSTPGPADSGGQPLPPEVIIVPDEPDVEAPPAEILPEVQPPGGGKPMEPVCPPEGEKPKTPLKGKLPFTGGDLAAVVYTGVVLIAFGVFLRRRD